MRFVDSVTHMQRSVGVVVVWLLCALYMPNCPWGVLAWDLQIEDHMSNPDTSNREKLYDT